MLSVYCVFSPPISMACILGFCLVASIGQNHTGTAARNSKNKAKVCTWDKDLFRRVCMATLDGYNGDFYQKTSTFGQMIDALGLDVSVFSICGGSTFLVEAFCENLGRGYRQKLIDNPSFDLLCSNFVCNGQFAARSGVWMDLQ